MRPGSIVIVSVLLCIAGVARGDLIVTAVPPADSCFISQTARSVAADMIWRSSQHIYFGQTFTAASDATLEKIAVMMNQQPSHDRMTAGMDLTLKVWSASSVAATSGSVITQTRGLTTDFDKGAYYWLVFDLPDTHLTGGQTYGFTIDFSFFRDPYGPPSYIDDSGHEIGGNNPAGIQYVGGNVYSEGQAFRLIGESLENSIHYDGSSTQDLAFMIIATPEPASIITLGIGAMTLLSRRRR